MKKVLNWLIGEVKFKRNMIRSYRITIIKQGNKIAYEDFDNLTDVIDFFATAKLDKLPKHIKRQVTKIYINQVRPNIAKWKNEDEAEVITIQEIRKKYSK